MFRGDSFDYRLNASFDITDDVMIYGQYATAFKGGGVNAQPFFPNQAFPSGPRQLAVPAPRGSPEPSKSTIKADGMPMVPGG